MNDNDIIKALECCCITPANCKECPLGVIDNADCFRTVIHKNALDLINRQKAEIERLKGMVSQNEGVLPQYEAFIKAEAIKEFAERLKASAFSCDVSFGFGREHCEEAVTVLEIDRFVKEMTEETP